MSKKLRHAPLTADEILGFVDTQADFAFEMKVQARLLELGFSVEHGGTYIDPETDVPRQYDIRASRDHGVDGDEMPLVLRMAVECKTVADYYPLVVFTVPRSQSESVYDLLVSGEHLQDDGCGYPQGIAPNASAVTMRGLDALYPLNGKVGKSCTQVGIAKACESTYVSGDAGVYGKWSQAISSSHELVARSHGDFERLKVDRSISITLPVLVVPDGRLWIVAYNELGARTSFPNSVQRVSYLINKKVVAPHHMLDVDYNISHLEIVTVSGLDSLVSKFNEFNRNQIVDFEQVAAKLEE